MRAIKPIFLKWSLPSRSSSFSRQMSASGAMETFQQSIFHSFIYNLLIAQILTNPLRQQDMILDVVGRGKDKIKKNSFLIAHSYKMGL